MRNLYQTLVYTLMSTQMRLMDATEEKKCRHSIVITVCEINCSPIARGDEKRALATKIYVTIARQAIKSNFFI